MWNVVRAMLLLVFLAVGLPALLPWLKTQMPSYGLMSSEAYERQCELTTEKAVRHPPTVPSEVIGPLV